MKKGVLFVVVGLVLSLLALGVYTTFNDDKRTDRPSAEDLSVLEVEDNRLAKGDPDAPVTIVEYADVLCPYCAKVHAEVMPQLETDYIDTKKASYEIRLVDMIAPDSQRAAEGAYCAAEQDKFWPYMDKAYDETWQNYYSQGKGPEEITIFNQTSIAQFAKRVGLDIPSWQQCMDDDKYITVLNENRATMTEMEAYGTPHFLFNGQSYSGAPPYEFFKKALDAEYNKKVQSE